MPECRTCDNTATGFYDLWPTKTTGYPSVPLCDMCYDECTVDCYKVRKVSDAD